MGELYFWERWRPFQKGLLWGMLVTAALLIGLYAYCYFLGADAIISWFTLGRLEQLPLQYDSFAHLLQPIALEADAYLSFRRYAAGDMEVSVAAAHALSPIYLITLAMALAMCTYMSRLFFTACMAVFMLLTALMSLDVAGVFGHHGNGSFLIIISVYTAVAFYF